jgi:hypothetical protein
VQLIALFQEEHFFVLKSKPIQVDELYRVLCECKGNRVKAAAYFCVARETIGVWINTRIELIRFRKNKKCNQVNTTFANKTVAEICFQQHMIKIKNGKTYQTASKTEKQEIEGRVKTLFFGKGFQC